MIAWLYLVALGLVLLGAVLLLAVYLAIPKVELASTTDSLDSPGQQHPAPVTRTV